MPLHSRSGRAANKATNVGRIALEQQAGGKTVDHAGIRNSDLPLRNLKHYPLGNKLPTWQQAILFQQQALLHRENNRVLEEKRKNGQAKNLHKKDV